MATNGDCESVKRKAKATPIKEERIEARRDHAIARALDRKMAREQSANIELATASYRAFIPAMGVPVATSLGRPRFPIHYGLTEELGALKPWGLMSPDLPADEFDTRYRARLDRVGVDKLRRTFYAISNRHSGARLVLLCFENVLAGQGCHRRVWAEWWTERTGQVVPELSWVAGRSGVPVVVRNVAPAQQTGDDELGQNSHRSSGQVRDDRKERPCQAP
jgi:hypothetical protein